MNGESIVANKNINFYVQKNMQVLNTFPIEECGNSKEINPLSPQVSSFAGAAHKHSTKNEIYT